MKNLIKTLDQYIAENEGLYEAKNWDSVNPKKMAKEIIDNVVNDKDIDFDEWNEWIGGYMWNVLRNEEPDAPSEWIEEVYDNVKGKLDKGWDLAAFTELFQDPHN